MGGDDMVRGVRRFDQDEAEEYPTGKRNPTADWWDAHRPRFGICTSDLTIEEAGMGNPQAAARRLQALDSIAILPITEAVVELSAALLHGRALPTNAQNDAIHIGVSAVHGVDCLLTWNFATLPTLRPDELSAASASGRDSRAPEICTPSELIGGLEDV